MKPFESGFLRIREVLPYLHDLIQFLCVGEDQMLLDDNDYCDCSGLDQWPRWSRGSWMMPSCRA